MSDTTGPHAAKLDWLAEVLGISFPVASGNGSLDQDLETRQKSLIASLKEAAASVVENPERRAGLRDITLKASEAGLAIRKGDAAGAGAMLDAAEAALKQLLNGKATGGGGMTAQWQAARQAWQAASDTVDGQIAALQSYLKASGQEILEEIAEYGLNGVTGNFKVPLMAAMAEIGAGSADAIQKSGPKALQVIAGFRAHIDADEAVLVCDQNPFGVPVSIKATLGPALAQMEAALKSAA